MLPGQRRPVEIRLARGEEAEIQTLNLELRPPSERDNDSPWTLFETGKLHIQYGKSGQPPGSDLTTGKLELEVTDRNPARGATEKPAPAKTLLKEFEDTVSAPVAYKDTMLVLVTKTGVAAVVFTKETEEGVEYKYRYESSDGKTQLSGDGKLSEKDAGGKKFDLFIEAGPIPLRWSYADEGKGRVYYDPSLLSVNVASAVGFEDREEPTPFGDPMTVKKLDLKRFMQP